MSMPNSETDAEDGQTERREEADASARRERRRGARTEIEYWVWGTGLLAVLFGIAWGVALAGLGTASLYAHIFAIPIVGGLTLPVALWGIMRTVFRPPVFRLPRLVGFGILLTVGFFGNVPMFPAPVSTVDWRSGHTYRLPFAGEWYTLAGGEDLERNYHATTAAYRWAYDFAPVRDGSRYRGEGEKLSDYYCWGEPVVAPVGGEVVRFEDDRRDFPPREFDESSVFGNYVLLRVDEGEYLYLAHLKKGSPTVEAGERIERGERIGACGNSGRAVEPHVHVHLQDRLGFPVAQSLPLRFSNYRVRETGPIDRGMPLGEGEGGTPAGQFVEYLGRD